MKGNKGMAKKKDTWYDEWDAGRRTIRKRGSIK